MNFDRSKRTDEKLKQIYKALVTPRLIEERMLILLRQGKISKWFSGIGQEAVAVGATMVLDQDEYILPMHRNLGVFTTRKVPLERLFSQFQGKANGFTKGRDRSFHFGSNDHHIVGMISHLGPQLALADGIALACKLRKEKKATIVFSGDGGASEGDFHEALNVAAVWDLPVIFVIENNGYGLSTPSAEQFKCHSFADKGPGYGIEAHSIDGNNILEVLEVLGNSVKKVRKSPRPVLIEANTFRRRGHEEASGTKYVPKELMEYWTQKDPVDNYEHFLLSEKVVDDEWLATERKIILKQINVAIDKAFEEPLPEADLSQELSDIYAPYQQQVINPRSSSSSEKRYVDSISDGLRLSMSKFPEVIVMGQDISEYGGVFKVTEGFVGEFGKERVRNTPICESAIIGAGLGLSIKGMKAIIEMQFADFVTCGFNQIVNNLAKSYYRWGQHADVVIRMPTGAGVGAGPFHSQSNEAWFFHTPGLKIVYPSNPRDAKGLLASAIEDPNPYLYFEHKALYRSLTDEVPDNYYTTEVGKATKIQEGEDLTIITYGMGVHWAKEELARNTDISADLIDLRTLLPWDKNSVRLSIEKTGKIIILHEDCETGGIGAEIAAWVSENCFKSLDAPVIRCGSLDTPVPFATALEKQFLAKNRFGEKLRALSTF